MFRANRRSVKMETLLIITVGMVFLAETMKEEPNTYFGIVAEAGRIEVPPLWERETTGIYMEYSPKHNCVGLEIGLSK